MLRPIDIIYIGMPTLLWCPGCPFVQNFGGSLAQRQQYDKHRCRHMIIKYCRPLSRLIIIWHGELLNDLGQADRAVAELVETVQRLLGTPVRLFGSRESGLHLPTSDADLVVCGLSDDYLLTGAADVLHGHLRMAGDSGFSIVDDTRFERIGGTVSLSTPNGGNVEVKVDLSKHAAHHSGLLHSNEVARLLAELPPLAMLTRLIKTRVSRKSGGLSGHIIMLMAAAIIREQQSLCRDLGPSSIGPLLYIFLSTFSHGKLDDSHMYHVSCTPDISGKCIRAIPRLGQLLYVEDLLIPTRNAAEACLFVPLREDQESLGRWLKAIRKCVHGQPSKSEMLVALGV